MPYRQQKQYGRRRDRDVNYHPPKIDRQPHRPAQKMNRLSSPVAPQTRRQHHILMRKTVKFLAMRCNVPMSVVFKHPNPRELVPQMPLRARVMNLANKIMRLRKMKV